MAEDTDSFGNSFIRASGDIVSTIINDLFQQKTSEDNRAFAREQATTAYDRQIEQWNRQNAYDSPSAQMQRFIEAGLNPNLIYSDMGLGNVVQEAPVGNNASSPAVRMPNLGAAITDARLADVQIERLKTQNENDTKMTDAQITKFAHENDLMDISVKRAAADIEYTMTQKDYTTQQLENLKQEWSILDEKKQQEQFNTAFMEATQHMRIEGANAEQEAIVKTAVALAMANVLNVKADTALKWSQVNLNGSQISLNKAYERLSEAQKYQAYQYSNLIASQIKTENVRTQQVMEELIRTSTYNRAMYGDESDGWFFKGVHFLTTGIDASFKCMGQLLSFGAFAK